MIEEKKKGNFMKENFWGYLNNDKEIKLNFKSIPIIIFCLIIITLVGKFQGYLWTLKPNLLWTIIFFIFSFIAFIYNLIKKENIRTILLFLLATIFFLINMFYPIFK